MTIRVKFFCVALLLSFIGRTQNFSFQCARDTVLSGCAVSCFTLKATIPDIKGSTSNYVVNKVTGGGSCFSPAIAPNDAAGTSTNLTIDDRFSSVINLGFTFPFFGADYTQIVANTNGVISFDISKANGSAIFTVNSDLPSSAYERAVVMGPFHDLDPSKISSSPSLKIQYQVVGVAPHRRWVLSFYKVPLYDGNTNVGINCNNLIENTHQIVLYESTGIVEVLIFSKQPCPDWNGGKAIVGMQDMSRTSAIMAPGRSASSGPWGSINMNETWRFTPAAGNSLFKRVELFTMTGALVATGTTVADGNGNLVASFSNVCPALNTTSYIVKSVYEKFNDPSVEIIGTDTVRVLKNNMSATYTTTGATCTTLGSITVNLTPGTGTTPVVYSLDGGAPQTSNVFTNVLSGFPHNVLITDGVGCQLLLDNILLPGSSAIEATTVIQPTSCQGATNGNVRLQPTNGQAPFQYRLSTSSTWQTGNTFSGLSGGTTYTFFVKDNAGCLSNAITATVPSGPPVNGSITKTDITCFGQNNGTATVSLSANATAPSTFSKDNFVTTQTSPLFGGLGAGSYTFYFRDAVGCNGTATTTIIQPAQLTASAPVTQAPTCNGLSNGTITITGSGGTAPIQYAWNGAAFGSSNTTSVGAGTHSVVLKDANGCTITISDMVVTQPAVLAAQPAQTENATCNGGDDGRITVTATGGTSPYQYALNGGAYQASNIFSVAPNSYTISIKDANGCTVSQAATVGLTNTLTYTPLADKTICEGSSTSLTATTNATQFLWEGTAFPATTATQPSITVNPVQDSSRYILTATLGRCSIKDTAFVLVNAAPVPNAGPDHEICYGKSDTLAGSGGAVYNWSPSTYLQSSSSLTSNINMFDPVVFKPERSITYTLSVTDATGCRSLTTDDVTITVTPPIVVRISPVDTVGFIGDKIQLAAFSAATDYSWTLLNLQAAPELSNPAIINPILTVVRDETYRVVASTAGGCAGVGTVAIKAYKGPDIYVPDAFTPNHDGKNDFLRPFPVGVQTLNYFRVFDRWGGLVYEYKGEKRGPVVFNMMNSNIGWNGMVNGKELTTGAYVWLAEGVTKEGKKVSRKGVATLIR